MLGAIADPAHNQRNARRTFSSSSTTSTELDSARSGECSNRHSPASLRHRQCLPSLNEEIPAQPASLRTAST